VIGNIKSDFSHLALLVGTPVIQIAKAIDTDYLQLINPLNTPVIFANSIQEGVKIYEDNF
jgi:hypothetical protein